MEVMTEYKKFADAVDSCADEESLKECSIGRSQTAVQKEYWRLRQAFFASQDTLEKQKIKAKIYWMHQTLGFSVPIKQSVKRFTSPNGLSGIIIAPEATLGKGCVIFQNVYIGADTLTDSRSIGFPTVGNDVYIGAGVNIIGNVVIGDNVRIDPNCYITTDISANSHVINNGSVTVRSDIKHDNTYLTAKQAMEKHFGNAVYDYHENTGDETLSVRMAAADDLDLIMELYKERVSWFKWKKISQWVTFLINHPKEEFLRYIENGEYYVVTKSGKTVGGFVINADTRYWEDESADALYLRRVVTDPTYRHLGEYIVEQVKKLTEEAGKSTLRIECIFSNQELNNVWDKLGFKFVRDVESNFHFSLRELKLTEVEADTV